MLSLEKAEEQEIKLPAFNGLWRKQGNSRKTSTPASLTMLKLLTVWITTNWKILKEMGVPDQLTCLLINLFAGQEANVRIGHEAMDWFKIRKRVGQGCILLPCLFNLYAEYIIQNAGDGWITSWNQDWWEKYQLPQIRSWYHCNGRTQRGTKEPLDGERGQWKSGMKLNIIKTKN